MPRIQTPQVGQLLQRLFKITGRYRPSLEEFIVPTVQIADLGQGSPPPIIRSATSFFSQAAVVGERATFRLECPPTTLLTLDSMLFTAGSSSSIEIFLGSSVPAPATPATTRFTDGRILQANENTAGKVNFGTQAAGLAAFHFRQALLSGVPTLIKPLNWIVGSGVPVQFGFIDFQFGPLNVSFEAILQWTEYQIA